MKPGKKRQQADFRRDEPDLPSELEEPGSPDSLFEGDEIVIEELRVGDVVRAGLKARSLRVDGSVLERVQLAQGQFGSVVWKDVRLVGCDLANVLAHRMTLVRVELIDCRMTGLRARALDWQDVLVQGGDLRYAQFQEGAFRACEFDRCNLEEADLQAADLSGSVIRSCQLGRADFRGAKLQGTDFRKSEVDGMVVGMGDLQGSVVDAGQAMVFARLLGVEIR